MSDVHAVIGVGVVTAAGPGCDALRALAWTGASGARPITRFVTDAFADVVAAMVPGFDAPPCKDGLDGRPLALAEAFAALAIAEALAGLDAMPRARVALVIGTNVEDRPNPLDGLAHALADRFDVGGPAYCVSIACASATSALGHAIELLDRGDADRVIVGGTDVVTPRLVGGFQTLGALSDGPSAPFGQTLGMLLGDGAAFFVVERRARAALPPGTPALLGFGLAADAYHPTRPAPDGRGVAAATLAALAHAGLVADQIDYVNAHGTGTEANDLAEWRGLSAALGPRVPTSSIKGMIGHTQGAAGAIEVALTLLLRAEGAIPATVGLVTPRPGAPPDPVAGPLPRRGPCRTFLSSSAGFGGANAVIAVGDAAPAVRTRRPVWVAGVGAVGPGGVGAHAAAGLAGDCAPLSDALLPRELDPDAADPSTRRLAAAAAEALRDAGIRLDRQRRARSGLVVGQRVVGAAAGRLIEAEADNAGVTGLSGRAFARALLVSPAGAVAAALGLQGPLDVVCMGRASGLSALVHAAELLATRPALDVVLAAATDETDPRCDWGGSVAVALTAAPSGRGVALLGWAVAGDPQTAIAAACARAGVPVRPAHRAERAGGPACEGLLAVLAGLAEGGVRVVVSDEGGRCAAIVVGSSDEAALG